MLKKARSFRDDVKGYLRRRSSASTHESAIVEAKQRHSKSYATPPETRRESSALSEKVRKSVVINARYHLGQVL